MTKARLIMTITHLKDLFARCVDEDVELVVPPEGAYLPDWLAREGRGVRAAIVGGNERFDTAGFDLLPDLCHLATFGDGMEGIDVDEAERRGVTVSKASGLHSGEVANHALALMFAARRRILEGDAWVRRGRWLERRMPPTPSVTGMRAGIVGLGQIGEAIAERLGPLGCSIAWWGPREKPTHWPRAASLLELAQESDALFIAVRSDETCRGLIDRAIIDALGSDGLLINVSRGFVVDEDAMIAALRDGRLGQVALDVFDPEPPSPDRWADVPNAVLSPHHGGGTTGTIVQLAESAVARVRPALADSSPRSRN